MGRNRQIRKRIAGLQQVCAEHEEKIRQELSKTHPDERRIECWQHEVGEWKKQMARLHRRLGGK